MFEEDADADGDEDEAAEEFGLEAAGDFFAVVEGDAEAEEAAEEGDETDGAEGEGEGGETVVAGAGEGDAYGEGVYAGGQRQRESGFQALGVDRLLPFLPECINYHLSAYECEHPEGYPVVHRLQISTEAVCQQPPDKRHKRLEQTNRKPRIIRQLW